MSNSNSASCSNISTPNSKSGPNTKLPQFNTPKKKAISQPRSTASSGLKPPNSIQAKPVSQTYKTTQSNGADSVSGTTNNASKLQAPSLLSSNQVSKVRIFRIKYLQGVYLR